MRIKKVSEELKYEDIISVLDVEDYLQEVWDKYSSSILDYTIQRSFVDVHKSSGTSLDLKSTDDDVIHKGDNEIKSSVSNNLILRQQVIDYYKGSNIGFEIVITLKPEDNIFWDEFIKTNFLIEFLSDINSGLRRTNPIEIYTSINGPKINLSIITNITL